MHNYLLGVDIGTGSAKAIAMRPDGSVLLEVRESYTTVYPVEGYSEQDPQQLWQAFVKCVNKVSNELGNPKAISLSSAMHGLIAVDDNCGALSPMLTWADTRSAAIADGLRNSAEGHYAYHTSGTPVHPMSPLCKIIWLKQNQPQLFDKAYKFISIKEFIWYRLFGVFEIDYSIASATGLFNIKTLAWDAELCTLAGITGNKLSVPVNTNFTRHHVVTDIAAQLNIAPDTLFIIGASDGCCANLGSYILQRGIAALTIGTSGAVRITGKTPVDNYQSMIFNYLLNKETFVSGGAINNGGAVVNWLITILMNKPADSSAYQEFFNAVAASPPGSDGLLFLPYVYGERAPIWDSKASGSFLNIKAAHTQHHFLRAGLEGICYALNDVLLTLEKSSGTKIKQLHVSGGFTNSAVWVQLLADVTGKQLTLLHHEDASAIGAVYLAMQVSGHPLPPCAEKKIINPDKTRYALYVKNFRIFKKAYKALQQIPHPLTHP